MILTLNNTKFLKTSQYNVVEAGISLLPYNLANEKVNLCPFSSPSCRSSCLAFSGRGGVPRVNESRKLKTISFLNDRKKFLLNVSYEISTLELNNEKVVIRLNTLSDIDFQKYKLIDGKTIFELHPNVTFIDYTKNPYTISLFPNYHIIYSADKYNATDDMIIDKLKRGQNIAMVFKDKLPKTWNGFEVIDGDKSDIEWVGRKGIITGLSYKNVIRKGVKNEELLKNNTLIYG